MAALNKRRNLDVLKLAEVILLYMYNQFCHSCISLLFLIRLSHKIMQKLLVEVS